MRYFAVVFVIVSIAASILVVAGVGIGFLLHWCLPAIDFGMATLIGVVAIAFAAQGLSHLVDAYGAGAIESPENDDFREEDAIDVIEDWVRPPRASPRKSRRGKRRS
jgi:hypothetical protein